MAQYRLFRRANNIVEESELDRFLFLQAIPTTKLADFDFEEAKVAEIATHVREECGLTPHRAIEALLSTLEVS